MLVATDADAVLRNWEQIKQREKAALQGIEGSRMASLLGEIPRTMPAMLEAAKLGFARGEGGVRLAGFRRTSLTSWMRRLPS